MPEPEVSAALAAVQGLAGRASAPRRTADGALGVMVDVTGLDEAARRLLDAELRRALAAIGEDVRVAYTAEKVVRRLLAVASGKGGVGKSTLAANLAVALARGGLAVGLVDADIYGPSQTRLMGIGDTAPEAAGETLLPTQSAFGVPVLSMGQLIEPGRAVAWRGPMVGKALGQLIDADWGAAELLVVDLPPGTGDVQLSMIQRHRPAGAVIVSTPQDLALMDAVRAIDLFRRTDVPLVGLVENMAGYACPHCGEVSDPFGMGGAEAAAAGLGLPFLGRVPLDAALRRRSDAGDPPAAGDDAVAQAFQGIAAEVARWLREGV